MLISLPEIILPIVIIIAMLSFTFLFGETPALKKFLSYTLVFILGISTRYIDLKVKHYEVQITDYNNSMGEYVIKSIDPTTKKLVEKYFRNPSISIGQNVEVFYDVENKKDQYATWSENALAYGNIKIHLAPPKE
jgi:hypothetical protein